MRRLVAALCLASMLGVAAQAQAPERVYRLGVLAPGSAAAETLRETILPELARLGFVEGQNLVVDVRLFTHAGYEGTTARHLVASGPDALIGVGPLAIAGLKEATATVPIVMSLGPDDPAAHGFADSLGRPTRNITGLIAMSNELDGKRLQILKEAVPAVRRVAVFLAPDMRFDAAGFRNTAADLGVEFVDARTIYVPQEFPAALDHLHRAGAEALMIVSAPLFSDDLALLVDLATAVGMPTVCDWRGLVERGCLIGYGPSLSELRRRTADYVVRVFRGKVPSEMPIEGPIRFDLTLNLKTARSLSVRLPPTLLARADEVIE